tara:strand:+ start:4769 stop:6076 length:1308 start_codon:yes stop_codon:yes gene_type:complete
MNRSIATAILICAIALIPRALSVQWNTIVHGDIAGDAGAAASFADIQQLLVTREPNTITPHYLPPGIARNLLIAHPPIWSLLGAGVISVLRFDPTPEQGYLALKLLSVLSGMAVLVLSFIVARKLFDHAAALWILVWLSASYLLIDYSGNGSLYSLQAATYLVWILVAYKPLRHKPVWLGVVSGIAYLVNHQSMILAAASAVFLLVSRETKQKRLWDFAIVTLVTFLIALPWLLRNQLIYDSWLFGHTINATYVYVKAGISHYSIGDRSYYDIGMPEKLHIWYMILTVWLPNNLYYIARKLFILAPVMFAFFSFAWVDYLFSHKRVRIMLPVLLVCVLHILLSAAWPITKFRYFVPLLPLVYFVGMDQFRSLRLSSTRQRGFLVLTTVCVVVLSYLTYHSTPTHTYYYDGAITQDPFHSRGEMNFLKEKGFITEE